MAPALAAGPSSPVISSSKWNRTYATRAPNDGVAAGMETTAPQTNNLQICCIFVLSFHCNLSSRGEMTPWSRGLYLWCTAEGSCKELTAGYKMLSQSNCMKYDAPLPVQSDRGMQMTQFLLSCCGTFQLASRKKTSLFVVFVCSFCFFNH